MKEYFRGVASQATAILLAAAGAALFTFFQSIVADSGICPAPVISPEATGTVAAAAKAIHSAVTTNWGTMRA